MLSIHLLSACCDVVEIVGPPGSFQTFVVVELLVGGVGYVRHSAGRREGECRPSTEAKATTEAQGEEGECRLT